MTLGWPCKSCLAEFGKMPPAGEEGCGAEIGGPELPFWSSLLLGRTRGTGTWVLGGRSIPIGHRHSQGPRH